MNVIRKGTVATRCMIMVGLLLAIGCKKDNGEKGDNPPEEPTYPIEIPFEEYFIYWNSTLGYWEDGVYYSNFPCWENLKYDIHDPDFLEGKLSVINSNEELENSIICPKNYPEIDFAKQTLLLASGIGTSGIGSIATRLMQLERKYYELEVEIKFGITAELTPWQVAIIIDKIDVDSIIDLKRIKTY